jgi:predicted TIM-barrel fold metal-dependent hydrolase
MTTPGEQLVDCDVHPVLPHDVKDLLPYLPPGLRRSIEREVAGASVGEAGRPVGRYTHPSPAGNLRGDAVPPSGSPAGSDPRFVVKDHLDARGIGAAVLIPLAINVWPYLDRAADMTAAMNDYLVEKWLTVDQRFKLAAIVFPVDAAKAAAEIRRLAGHESVVAVSMPLMNAPMGDPSYEPILAAAAEVGLPIVIHPSGAESTYLAGPSSAGGVPETFLERHITLSQVASSNLCSLIWRGAFDRYPGLRVIFVEYGFTWAPWVAGRMDSEWNAMPADDRPTRRLPSSYVWDHVRFTTQPLEEPDEAPEMVRVLKAIHAEETLLFSSDYPHWDSDDPNHVLRYVDGPLRARILRANAIQTFGAKLALSNDAHKQAS